jgi:hypothetical protein
VPRRSRTGCGFGDRGKIAISGETAFSAIFCPVRVPIGWRKYASFQGEGIDCCIPNGLHTGVGRKQHAVD